MLNTHNHRQFSTVSSYSKERYLVMFCIKNLFTSVLFIVFTVEVLGQSALDCNKEFLRTKWELSEYYLFQNSCAIPIDDELQIIDPINQIDSILNFENVFVTTSNGKKHEYHLDIIPIEDTITLGDFYLIVNGVQYDVSIHKNTLHCYRYYLKFQNELYMYYRCYIYHRKKN